MNRFFFTDNLYTEDSFKSNEPTNDNVLATARKWWNAFAQKESEILVLPKKNTEGQISWLVIQRNKTEISYLQKHFINLFGGIVTIKLQDERESKFLQIDHTESETTTICDLLNVYLSVLRRKPKLPMVYTRSFGDIRYDFENALINFNKEKAEELFQEMISTGRLSAQNEIFLKLRMVCTLENFAALKGSEEILREVCVLSASLSERTALDLVIALYELYIKEQENESLENVYLFFEKLVRDFSRNSIETIYKRQFTSSNALICKNFFFYLRM